MPPRASRTMSRDHHSPMVSSERATGHALALKDLCRIAPRSSPVTSWSRVSGMGCCYLEAELCGLLPEEVDLLLAVFLFFVFRPFFDVVFTSFQHAINQ